MNIQLLQRELERALRRKEQQEAAVQASGTLAEEASGNGLHALAARQRQIRTRQTIALHDTMKQINDISTLLKVHTKQIDIEDKTKNSKK